MKRKNTGRAKATKNDLLDAEVAILAAIGEDFIPLQKNRKGGGGNSPSTIKFREAPSASERALWEAQGLAIEVDPNCNIAAWKQLSEINKAAGGVGREPLSLVEKIMIEQDRAN